MHHPTRKPLPGEEDHTCPQQVIDKRKKPAEVLITSPRYPDSYSFYGSPPIFERHDSLPRNDVHRPRSVTAPGNLRATEGPGRVSRVYGWSTGDQADVRCYFALGPFLHDFQTQCRLPVDRRSTAVEARTAPSSPLWLNELSGRSKEAISQPRLSVGRRSTAEAEARRAQGGPSVVNEISRQSQEAIAQPQLAVGRRSTAVGDSKRAPGDPSVVNALSRRSGGHGVAKQSRHHLVIRTHGISRQVAACKEVLTTAANAKQHDASADHWQEGVNRDHGPVSS